MIVREFLPVFLGLGASLGDRMANLRFAVDRLRSLSDSRIAAISRVYETAPVGGVAARNFLNAAVRLDTLLTVETLAEALHKIEDEAGRQRRVRWEDRTLDIDILYFGNLCIESESLVIPHPRLHERRFVLVPLCDIAADHADPRTDRAVRDLLSECPDRSRVELLCDRLDSSSALL